MRSAAWPSQSSGVRPRLPPVASTSNAASTMRDAVGAAQRVGAFGDRDRPLGVLAHRQARHAERGRLLLQAAGVGQHQRRIGHQAEHLEIALRRQQRDARRVEPVDEAELGDARLRARMQREDERQPRRDRRPARRAGARASRRRRRSTAGAASRRRSASGRRRGTPPARPAGRRASSTTGSPPRDSRAACRSSRCRRSTMRSSPMPSACRLSRPPRSVVYSRSAIWSVSTRLISSGIARS